MHQNICLCSSTHSHKQRNFEGIPKSTVKLHHNPSLRHLDLLSSEVSTGFGSGSCSKTWVTCTCVGTIGAFSSISKAGGTCDLLILYVCPPHLLLRYCWQHIAQLRVRSLPFSLFVHSLYIKIRLFWWFNSWEDRSSSPASCHDTDFACGIFLSEYNFQLFFQWTNTD